MNAAVFATNRKRKNLPKDNQIKKLKLLKIKMAQYEKCLIIYDRGKNIRLINQKCKKKLNKF